MYCGDETGSFIGEIGSHSARFGYGGEDCPKYVIPSCVAEYKDANSTKSATTTVSSCYSHRLAEPDTRIKTALRKAKLPDHPPDVDPHHVPTVDPLNYLQQGDEVEDWDAYEELWQSAFDVLQVRDTLKHSTGGGGGSGATTRKTTRLSGGVESSTVRSQNTGDGRCIHPLLAISPGCSFVVGSGKDKKTAHRKELVKFTEIMMEKIDCKALFVAPTPMLAAFSYGRQTALVVDIGASGCRVTPVVDGLLLKQAQRRNGRGGDWLGNVQWRALLENKTVLRPRYQLNNGRTVREPSTGFFHKWAMNDLMYELRTSEHVAVPEYRQQDSSVPFVHPESAEDASDDMQVDNNSGYRKSIYELPDGTLIDMTSRTGTDLCRVPELLFTDEVPFLSEGDMNRSVLEESPTLSNLPLHKLVRDSLSAVGDVDMRKELASNILLTGGSSLFRNLEKRLSVEVSSVIPGSFKCKVLASRHTVERSCGAWIGASILTSLGSFQQLWLSRTEYEEYGVALAVQRFP